MKTPEKPDAATQDAGTAVSTVVVDAESVEEPTYILARRHRHAGVWYEAGHEFKASEWGLTEKQLGWLQGAGTIA